MSDQLFTEYSQSLRREGLTAKQVRDCHGIAALAWLGDKGFYVLSQELQCVELMAAENISI